MTSRKRKKDSRKSKRKENEEDLRSLEAESVTITEDSSFSGQQGWVCPKCGSVWSPYILGCQNCNQQWYLYPTYPYVSDAPVITWQYADGTVEVKS